MKTFSTGSNSEDDDEDASSLENRGQAPVMNTEELHKICRAEMNRFSDRLLPPRP